MSVEERKPLSLSERWTRIANILPNSLGSSSVAHPDLFVDPNGFRRVVQESLKTCEEFLETLQKIENAIEKRMTGITSYYGLVVKSSRGYDYYGGNALGISGNIALSLIPDRSKMSGGYAASVPDRYEGPPPPKPQEPPKKEIPKGAIFERAGDAVLYNNHKLEPEEVIAFQRALNILTKLDSLRDTATECITTFGALNEVLDVGKVFSYQEEKDTEYYGEHAIKKTRRVQESLFPLQSYWNTLTRVGRIKAVSKKLSPNLVNL